ncbi:DUF3560 domain-containing protein [Sphingobacterium corticibacter]|uniref:DUF3560 domain-containing protein n=1 Tax=Sphingobacterium corticibacter TaxID=2171749 RepID=A0A2T8HLQ8_9SPHI|nr:DUF3560 domain-containing protein [Sphingobacterium corticibacter]PVH26320.1 hypothetical protein DC487_01445 [Sphingobacterium corticibacter]
MNTYAKFCPNVFVAKCTELHEKGAIINVTTKYGKENECEVHNLVIEKDGHYYFSITRTDGFNSQQRAKNKADRLISASSNATGKSNNYYEASQEGKDFLSLGEPIKVGHHSEKRHRALIERNHNRMANAVKFADKAEEYEQRAEYWEKKANDINLSMPESLDFYEFKLEQAKKLHEDLKSGKVERSHSFSLTYAKRDVNELTKKLQLAQKLWA